MTDTSLDLAAVRAAFDRQIRRNADAGEPGAMVEADAGVLRWVAPGTQTSCIIWSSLTGDSADAVIAAQQALLQPLAARPWSGSTTTTISLPTCRRG